jgi:hypothetical protein
MLGEASPSLEERTDAFARVVQLEPENQSAQSQLKFLQALQNDPYDLARYYEELGDRKAALATYKQIALTCKTREEWDTVHAHLTRLEGLQVEKIRHISPTVSLVRLTAGPPVLYLFSLGVHYGMRLNHASFLMWAAFFICIFGAFLDALAGLRLHHPFWKFLGEEGTSGSRLSRLALRISGVSLILVSFLPLLADSLVRFRELNEAIATGLIP